MVNNQAVTQILRNLLDGASPNGTQPAELGDWRDTVQALYDAHASGGTEAVHRVYNALAAQNPGLMALVAAGDGLQSEGIASRWKIRNLKDAYTERPPWEYVVDGVMLIPSLNIVYGASGSLKSMLLADLAACIAGGIPWLEPLPGQRGDGLDGFACKQYPVLWIDFDNGRRRTDERIEAIARSRNLSPDIPLLYVSMPRPWLNIGDILLINQLAELIKGLGVRVIFIDNLGLVTGNTEENNGEMAQLMGNLRWLADEHDLTITLIHHQRKSNGTIGGSKGDALRGHSSIMASLDLALLVERPENKDDITITPTKIRGYGQFSELGAMFTYEHRPGTYDLQSAKFWGISPSTAERKDLDIIADVIHEILLAGPMQTELLITAVRDDMASQPGGKAPGINRVRGLIKRLCDAGELRQSSASGKKNISLP